MNNHLLFLLFLIPILLCLFTASSVKAAELPVAKPVQVGFSAERLDRLSQGMQAYVEQKKVAGGLLSTARDYATFLLMLQQGGELNGVRLLSPKSIELMTANHVGDLYGSGGFGLGF